MAKKFPQFSFRPNRQGGLVWKGLLRPTPDSDPYAVRIVHNPNRSPKVFVDSHFLDPKCRHLYPDKALCLFWPKEWWWTLRESLSDTLVPWTAFWLYFYEVWQVCGEWLGPSSPHGLEPVKDS
jgi:hypothetical protein